MWASQQRKKNRNDDNGFKIKNSSLRPSQLQLESENDYIGDCD